MCLKEERGGYIMYTNTLKLNNGVEIPQLGLGTWFIDDDKVTEQSIDHLFLVSFRLFTFGICLVDEF